MFKSLLRYFIFSLPINIISALQYIIFEDAEIIQTDYLLNNRTEMKLVKEVETLNNLLEME